MGIAEKFSDFYEKIKMSRENMEIISYRYNRLSKTLSEYFYGSSSTNYSLYVGSYGRDTEVYISDIDMLFKLPYSKYKQYDGYYGNGQSALLQEVKVALLNTYPKTTIKGDGQIVSVYFADGTYFEVLPVFKNTDESFTFPDSNDGGKWKITNPQTEQKAIQDMNNSTNKNLKKLCRIMRVWKEQNNVQIPGILIDVLAYNFIKDYVYKDKSYLYYDLFTRDFLKFLSEVPMTQNKWLVMGSNRYIYHYLSFQSKAKDSYNIAVNAIDYETRGFSYSSNQEWRKIYGSQF